MRERQLAQDVDAYLYPTELAGIFGVVATARSGVAGARSWTRRSEVLAGGAGRAARRGELVGAVRRARRDQVAGLGHVEERAEELAYAATVLGSPEALERVLAGYARVTPEAVREAAARLPRRRAPA